MSSRHLKQVSNESPNHVSVVLHQDVSVVHIHGAPLVRLYEVSRKSQKKYQIMFCSSLHHFSEENFCDALSVGFYYVFKLLCHDFQPIAFHVSYKYHIKHQMFLVPTRR